MMWIRRKGGGWGNVSDENRKVTSVGGGERGARALPLQVLPLTGIHPSLVSMADAQLTFAE